MCITADTQVSNRFSLKKKYQTVLFIHPDKLHENLMYKSNNKFHFFYQRKPITSSFNFYALGSI
jgi:hypothetical protein